MLVSEKEDTGTVTDYKIAYGHMLFAIIVYKPE